MCCPELLVIVVAASSRAVESLGVSVGHGTLNTLIGTFLVDRLVLVSGLVNSVVWLLPVIVHVPVVHVNSLLDVVWMVVVVVFPIGSVDCGARLVGGGLVNGVVVEFDLVVPFVLVQIELFLQC